LGVGCGGLLWGWGGFAGWTLAWGQALRRVCGAVLCAVPTSSRRGGDAGVRLAWGRTKCLQWRACQAPHPPASSSLPPGAPRGAERVPACCRGSRCAQHALVVPAEGWARGVRLGDAGGTSSAKGYMSRTAKGCFLGRRARGGGGCRALTASLCCGGGLTRCVPRRTARSPPTSTPSPWPPAPASTTTSAPSRGRMAPPPPSPSRIPTSRPLTARATKQLLHARVLGGTVSKQTLLTTRRGGGGVSRPAFRGRVSKPESTASIRTRVLHWRR